MLPPTKSRRENLPSFLFFLVIFSQIGLVFVQLGVFIKLFIFKEFVVFVVEVWAGFHGWCTTELEVWAEQERPAPEEMVPRRLPQVWQELRRQRAPRQVELRTWSSNAVRISGTPKTDLAATAFRVEDRASPSARRSAGSARSLPRCSFGDSIARFRISVYRYAMVSGIVLSGGRSSRMGRPKALLPAGADGRTFLERVTQTLLDGGVGQVIAVLGADAAVIRERARPAPRVMFVDNPDFERGQLTSLWMGLRHVDRSNVSGVLVTLVDVPLVSVETVRAILAAHGNGEPDIVRPVSNGRHGHPVIFHRRLFEELEAADPSVGAKAVVRAHPKRKGTTEYFNMVLVEGVDAPV